MGCLKLKGPCKSKWCKYHVSSFIIKYIGWLQIDDSSWFTVFDGQSGVWLVLSLKKFDSRPMPEEMQRPEVDSWRCIPENTETNSSHLICKCQDYKIPQHLRTSSSTCLLLTLCLFSFTFFHPPKQVLEKKKDRAAIMAEAWWEEWGEFRWGLSKIISDTPNDHRVNAPK